MSAQIHAGLNYSHPAVERFAAAVENFKALLQMVLAMLRQVRTWPVWVTTSEALVRYNQRRVEAMIMRDPRISNEIRMAFLRSDSSPR